MCGACPFSAHPSVSRRGPAPRGPGVYVMRKWKKQQVSLGQLCFSDEVRLADCVLYRLAVGCPVSKDSGDGASERSGSGGGDGDSER